MKVNLILCVIGAGTDGNASEESPSRMGSQHNFGLVPAQYDKLSNLGVRLLRQESSRAAIVQFLLNAITWSDSANSLTATFQISTVMRQLRSDENLTDELAAQTMIALLKGLQLHGQHDTNVGCLLNATTLVYQLVRPIHAQVAEILASLPGADAQDFREFEKIALSTVYTIKIEKRKRQTPKEIIKRN